MIWKSMMQKLNVSLLDVRNRLVPSGVENGGKCCIWKINSSFITATLGWETPINYGICRVIHIRVTPAENPTGIFLICYEISISAWSVNS